MSECDVSRVSEYWRRKAVYTGEPYACEPPVYESVDIEEGLTAQQTLNKGSYVYAHGLNYISLITSIAILKWICESLL